MGSACCYIFIPDGVKQKRYLRVSPQYLHVFGVLFPAKPDGSPLSRGSTIAVVCSYRQSKQSGLGSLLYVVHTHPRYSSALRAGSINPPG